MLLDYMRKNTKRFLYVMVPPIIVAFVLWGTASDFGSPPSQTLIEVGGQEVSKQEFLDHYYRMRQNMESSFGGNLTPEIEKMLNLKQQALDGLIQKILLEREIERMKITVSDQEVEASIKQYPEFQTDGKFDPVKWNSALSNPRINWVLISAQEKQSLKIGRLIDSIQSAAYVTEEELKDEYRRQNEKVEVEFVSLKAGELAGDVEVSPEDASSYYERNKEDYAEPAKVKLAYVELKKEPSELDHSDARGLCQKILERVQAGDDFAELVEYYSDDTATEAKGGDLGFFRKGRMAKKFEEAAFSTEPGRVSDIVKTQFGYHIIKVEGTVGEGDEKQVSARHILVKVEPSEDTLISLEEKAVHLASVALSSTLEEAAEQKGLTMGTTPTIPESAGVIPGIGVVREITEILSGLQEGKISDVIENENAFYIVQVTERTEEQIPELTEIEERIVAVAKAEKIIQIAKKKAEEIVADINENGATLADTQGMPQPQSTQPFTRRGYAPELPSLDGLTEKIFDLDAGMAANPVANGDSIIIFVSKGKIAADPEGFEKEKDSIRARFLLQRKRQVLDDYLKNLREEAGVRIDSELFGTV